VKIDTAMDGDGPSYISDGDGPANILDEKDS
jgi:hypothetical protein